MEKRKSDTRSSYKQVLCIIIYITVLCYPHETRYKEKLLDFIQVCGLDSSFILTCVPPLASVNSQTLYWHK